MKYCLAILLVFISAAAFTQNPPVNGMLLLQHRPLNFSFTKPEHLLEQQVLSNAVEIRLNTESQGLSTYAQVIFTDNAARAYFDDKLSLRLAYRNSNNAMMGMQEIALDNLPALLFTQPRSPGSGISSFNFIYDLILKPLTNFIKPDSYSFSLLITITPE